MKRKNSWKNIKNSTKGFTLVELVVVLAIISILLVSVFSLFGPVTRMINTVKQQNISDVTVVNLHTYIEKSIKTANHVYISKYTKEEDIKDYTYFDLTTIDGEKFKLLTVEDPSDPTKTIPAEEIRCIRLKWGRRQGAKAAYGYFLQELDVKADGKIDFASASNVFNDAYYGDVFFQYDIGKAINPVNSNEIPYALTLGITTYSKADLSEDNLIRQVSENSFILPNIEQNIGVQESFYAKVVSNDGGKKINEMNHDERDIYIYYIVGLDL